MKNTTFESKSVSRQREGGPDEKWGQLVLDYVSENGFSELTLGKLSKDLGVSKASLNYQFGSLEQLCATLAEKFAEQDAIIVQEMYQQSRGITDFLRRILHGFLVAPTSPVTRLELLALSARKPEIFRGFRQKARADVRDFLTTLLLKDMCPVEKTDAVLDLVVNVFNGGIVQYLSDGDLGKVDAAMDIFSEAYSAMRQTWASEVPSDCVDNNSKEAPGLLVDGVLLDDLVDDLRQSHGVAGASIGVLVDGQIYQAGAGLLNLASGVECTPDSVFQIGSIGKVFTATLVMQLVDEGRVVLDDPVAKYLPDLVLADSVSARSLTVRQLLNHTGGIDGDFFPPDDLAGPSVFSYVQKMALLPNLYPPGQGPVTYSNASYVLAGRIVEVVTGLPWHHAVMSRICVPLGMSDAFADPVYSIRHRCAIGHIPNPSDPSELVAAPVPYLPRSIAPAGSVLTMSAKSLLKFAGAHLEDGVFGEGSELLSGLSARAMRSESVELLPFSRKGVNRWGLGWFLGDYSEYQMFGHDGSTMGQFAYLRVFPEKGVAFVLLTNSPSDSMFSDVERRLMKAFVGEAPSKDPKPKKLSCNFEKYQGRYESVGFECGVESTGQNLSVTLHNRAVGLSITGLLTSYSEDVFSIQSSHPLVSDEKVVFVGDDGSGRAKYARLGMRMAKRTG